MASITSPSLNNTIRADVPAINAILKALAKADPSILSDIENGTKRFYEGTSGWEFQELVNGAWTTHTNFNIDAQSVDGFNTSVDAVASTIVVRGTDGKLKGNLTGKADTAGTADKLASTLLVNAGGTGATSAADARTNLGVPPTNHKSTTTTYGVSSATEYGHSMAGSDTPKADSGTGAVGSDVTHFARQDHVHPQLSATSSVQGDVKLSDATDSTSAASASIAATPKAVKAAYDLANTAKTTADSAATAAENAGPPTNGTGIAVSGKTISLATYGTAGSYGPSANATPSFGSTFNVPYITTDAYGRVTASTKTVKIPALSITGGADTEKTYTSSGTFTATKTGVHTFLLVGGGGGGGGGGTSTSAPESGGGGGGGAVTPVNLKLTQGASVTITIGAGGAGGAPGGNGSAGGTTSITYSSSTWQALGGGGGGASATSSAGSGGAGGAGTAGSGGAGGAGSVSGGTGKTGAKGYYGAGGAGASTSGGGGGGGSYGKGGAGGTRKTSGAAGTQGSGGGGGGGNSKGSGGAGGAGLVKIWY